MTKNIWRELFQYFGLLHINSIKSLDSVSTYKRGSQPLYRIGIYISLISRVKAFVIFPYGSGLLSDNWLSYIDVELDIPHKEKSLVLQLILTEKTRLLSRNW